MPAWYMFFTMGIVHTCTNYQRSAYISFWESRPSSGPQWLTLIPIQPQRYFSNVNTLCLFQLQQDSLASCGLHLRHSQWNTHLTVFFYTYTICAKSTFEYHKDASLVRTLPWCQGCPQTGASFTVAWALHFWSEWDRWWPTGLHVVHMHNDTNNFIVG